LGTTKQQPNVIFILTDQCCASALGFAGNDIVQTPQLDEFAQEAINFTNAVSVLQVCTPYRASLLTGCYSTTTGMFINDLYLPSEELCMAEIFKEAGYKVWGNIRLKSNLEIRNISNLTIAGKQHWAKELQLPTIL